MKIKGYFAVILGMVLTAVVFLAGCDLTTSPGDKRNSGTGNTGGSGTSNSGELNGTWKYENFEIIINGDSYVMKADGDYYGKGTISYSVANKTFTFRSTHEWTGSAWSPASETTNGTLEYSGGNTLVISKLDNYTFLAGAWTKQTGNTIIVTGFPGSKYSDKVAVIMLYSSVEDAANEEVTAVGLVDVTGNTLTIPLTDEY
ncbi:MAG: hypothetical protein LBO76_03280, partial [Treponema sp.]|nr:hypothetical protein [Treponema sp.]